MRSEQEICKRLTELEGMAGLDSNELLNKLMPLESIGLHQSLRPFLRRQARGRLEGWIDAINWVMESPVNRE